MIAKACNTNVSWRCNRSWSNGQDQSSSSTAMSSDKTRGMLSSSPPPVMCTMPLTSSAWIKGCNDETYNRVGVDKFSPSICPGAYDASSIHFRPISTPANKCCYKTGDMMLIKNTIPESTSRAYYSSPNTPRRRTNQYLHIGHRSPGFRRLSTRAAPVAKITIRAKLGS